MKAIDRPKRKGLYLDAVALRLLSAKSQETGANESELIRRLIISAWGKPNKKPVLVESATGKDTVTA